MAQMVKSLPAMWETWVPGLARSPGEGNGYPLQDSGLENSMDCTAHGFANNGTQLSGFHSFFFSSPERIKSTYFLERYLKTNKQKMTFYFINLELKGVTIQCASIRKRVSSKGFLNYMFLGA